MAENTDHLTFNTLRVVRDVLNRRSLTRAADELGISQPAVSFHLNKFEKYTSRRIVRRSGNELVVSEGAEKIRSLLEKIISLKDEFDDILGGQWDDRVKLGIAVDLVYDIVQDKRAKMLINENKCFVENANGLHSEFINGKLDAIFVPVLDKVADMEYVLSVQFKWIGGILSNSNKDNSVPIIMDVGNSVLSKKMKSYLEERSIKYFVSAEVEDMQTKLILAKLGYGYTLVPEYTESAFGSIKNQLITSRLLSSGVNIAYQLKYRENTITNKKANSIFSTIESALRKYVILPPDR